MTIDVGKLVAMNAELGSSYLRRAREAKRARGTHEAPITLAKIASMQRSGTLSVSPEEWTDLVGNSAAVRRYTSDPFCGVTRGALRFEGPVGPVDIRPDASVVTGTHRWSALREAQADTGHAKCSYCGAPGQRIGTRCEYCQVAVSR